MANAGKTVFEQFTKVQSIHRSFYKAKMKGIPQLTIYTEFFHRAFVNPCTMFNIKGAAGALCAFFGNYGHNCQLLYEMPL